MLLLYCCVSNVELVPKSLFEPQTQCISRGVLEDQSQQDVYAIIRGDFLSWLTQLGAGDLHNGSGQAAEKENIEAAETMILAAPEKEVLKMQPLSKVKGLYKSMFGAEEYGSQYL